MSTLAFHSRTAPRHTERVPCGMCDLSPEADTRRVLWFLVRENFYASVKITFVPPTCKRNSVYKYFEPDRLYGLKLCYPEFVSFLPADLCIIIQFAVLVIPSVQSRLGPKTLLELASPWLRYFQLQNLRWTMYEIPK
jgi:hypothetical protein